jgi:hypothetical protein
LQSRGLLRWHPIKALLIRKRFHSSSKGTAASLGESQDRRDTQVDAAAGEGGGLPPLRRPRATPAQLPGRRLRVRVQYRRSEGFFKPCACLQPTGWKPAENPRPAAGGGDGRWGSGRSMAPRRPPGVELFAQTDRQRQAFRTGKAFGCKQPVRRVGVGAGSVTALPRRRGGVLSLGVAALGSPPQWQRRGQFRTNAPQSASQATSLCLSRSAIPSGSS